jgi:hypothetical protein
MKEIIRLALHAENPFVRLAACRKVLDRATGKPAREVVADDAPPVIRYILSWRTRTTNTQRECARFLAGALHLAPPSI